MKEALVYLSFLCICASAGNILASKPLTGIALTFTGIGFAYVARTL